MLESRMEIRVEWGHCDPARIVYNPNYHDWMEQGLVTLFEAAGLDLAGKLAEEPRFRGTPLVQGEAQYRAPARVGEIITLVSRVERFGGASFVIAHRFLRGDTVLVEARQTRVWGMAPEGDPDGLTTARIPDDVRARLSEPRTAHLRYSRS